MRVVAGIVLALLALSAPAFGADPMRAQQWGLDMIEADAAHQTSTGRGAVVAVIDTGIQADHPDLASQVMPGYDVIGADTTPLDGDGHGTHVSGIIAAASGNGAGVESVAPGAKLLPIRVLDDTGEGTDADVALGIQKAIDMGADVINLSLGAGAVPASSEAFDSAIGRALDRGIVVVAAAGNDGVPICSNQSGQGRMLCVGAVDRAGNRSYFSSFGLGLALVAPGGAGGGAGTDVLSTFKGSTYKELAGTSQATPHVAGVAALLIGRGIRGQAAVNRILATAKDAGLPGPDSFHGAGIVNAARAVAGLTPETTAAPAPTTPPPRAPAASAWVSATRAITLASLKRNGLLVRCRAAGAGRCRVSVYGRGRRLATGSVGVTLGRTASVRARLTPSAARYLARFRTTTLSVRVALPGAALQRRSVRVVR